MPTDLISLISPKNLILFIIIFTRLSGMMTTMPLMAHYPIPMQAKTWFMAVVAFVMFPVILAKTGFQIPTSVPELLIVLLKEFLIGYTVGFISNIIFISVEISANLISMQMGLTAAQAMDPITGDSSPILTQAYTIIAGFIFIGINGYQWIFSAIFKTFQVIPPGYGIFIDGNTTHNIIYMTSQIFTIGIGIALPIFAVLLITDVLLGFTAKMMPKMNIFMVALPVKIYLGLSLLIILTPQITSRIGLLMEKHLPSIITILGG